MHDTYLPRPELADRDPFALAGSVFGEHRRAEIMVGEFAGPLPPATDAGFADAERRLNGLRRCYRLLPHLGSLSPEKQEGAEQAIVEIGIALSDFLKRTPVSSLEQAAVQLRALQRDEEAPSRAVLHALLTVVERAAATPTGTATDGSGPQQPASK